VGAAAALADAGPLRDLTDPTSAGSSEYYRMCALSFARARSMAVELQTQPFNIRPLGHRHDHRYLIDPAIARSRDQISASHF
jgi:hypothetical protein